jgi:hypothetical protein
VIRQHFAGVEWAEKDFSRDEVRTNCIASTGEDNDFQTTQESDMEKST